MQLLKIYKLEKFFISVVDVVVATTSKEGDIIIVVAVGIIKAIIRTIIKVMIKVIIKVMIKAMVKVVKDGTINKATIMVLVMVGIKVEMNSF